MNTYYAAIVNHPNQKLDPDNNIPLIQIFHSATERNNWVKTYADNPHVKTIDSKQAIRWLRFTYRQYRNQKIPSCMSRDGVVTKFLRTCSFQPLLHTKRISLTPEEVIKHLSNPEDHVLRKIGYTR